MFHYDHRDGYNEQRFIALDRVLSLIPPPLLNIHNQLQVADALRLLGYTWQTMEIENMDDYSYSLLIELYCVAGADSQSSVQAQGDADALPQEPEPGDGLEQELPEPEQEAVL